MRKLSLAGFFFKENSEHRFSAGKGNQYYIERADVFEGLSNVFQLFL
jgi:hypothetical protein